MITKERANAIYNVDQWGGGYFQISESGHIDVTKNAHSLALSDIVKQAEDSGLKLPMLLRFTHVLHDRVKQLNNAFQKALIANVSGGSYTPVYPIKVNQQRRVVEEIVSVASEECPIGLEAGSKPELLAILAKAPADSLIVCNGYKDAEFIRLALLGEQLGHKVFIVIEKLSELTHIVEQSQQMNIKPRLGLRVRLSSHRSNLGAEIAQSKWQNSGGEKAKFGLTVQQIMDAIDICEQNGLADSLNMLHFHLGSQITDIQAIECGVKEAARYYKSLCLQGLPIKYFDIGGGLGIDYEGTSSSNYFSMNYSLDDYANAVVTTLADVCNDGKTVELPHIISESGRALTAHHAVLISNVIEHEKVHAIEQHSIEQRYEGDLFLPLQNILANEITCAETTYTNVMTRLKFHHEQFLDGSLSIKQYAQVEALYQQCLRAIQKSLFEGDLSSGQEALKTHIEEVLADKLFLNFSVFQSTPDVWGINQIFPVLPLQGLLRKPDARAVIQDITCDSDGRIEQYVDGAGIETTLPIPSSLAADEHIGIFLVGAYQEILGDMHNLFGDTDSADIVIDSNGQVEVTDIIHGDTVSDVLDYVNFDAQSLVKDIKTKLQSHSKHAMQEQDTAWQMSELDALLRSYTYLS